MMVWISLLLLSSMLFGHLVCLLVEEYVTQKVTITFVTEYIHFSQHDMPDMVQLNMTIEDEVTYVVTLFKRPERFQNVPVYVPSSAGHTQWTQAHTADDPLLDTQELTWYATRPNTALHLAACIVRVRHRGHSRVSIHLKDDGFLVLNDTAHSLKYIPPVKRGSGGLSDRYLLTKRRPHPSSVHHTRSSPDGMNIGTRASGCMHVYFDLCLHVDFDLYDRKGRSLSNIRTHIKDLMNKVQVLYDKLPSGNSFDFRVHMELANIFVETSIFNDPIKLRQTPLTQAVFNGEVFQDLLKAHDLLTVWLKDKYPAQCDHYILLTGTYPAEFQPDGEEVTVYSILSMGLSWNNALCYDPLDQSKHCSVVYDITTCTPILVAHEFAHNVGLPHVIRSQQCPVNIDQAIMSPILHYKTTMETVFWHPCSVSTLQHVLNNCLSFKPDLLIIAKAELDAACRSQFGPGIIFNWDEVKVNQSSVCTLLECTDGKGPVHYITTPHGIPCGPMKECDGHGACVFSTTAAQCDA